VVAVKPFTIVALTVTTPDVVVFKILPPEIEPPAVLGLTTLHVIVLLVAVLGATVPVSVKGMPAVAAVGTPEMPVTATKSVTVLNVAGALAGEANCVDVSALRAIKL